MAKPRRKIQVDAQILKSVEELERRIRENDRKTAEVLADVRQFRLRLREIYASR